MTRLNPAVPRRLEQLPPNSRLFWTSGRSGQLQLLRHSQTRRWIHPFWGVSDQSSAASPEPVSGNGFVYTFTMSTHRYAPEMPPLSIIAIVELVEQDDLRIVTNLVNCEPESVFIGMPVRVLFEDHGELAVPVFEPAP